MMEWSELYDSGNQPGLEDVSAFIDNSLWEEVNVFLQNGYQVQPRLDYSKCAAQKGWNIKYKKGGKSICTLYPMKGYFIALVVMGEREMPEAEFFLPSFTDYTQALYQKTPFSAGGKWLMIHVTDHQILEDVEKLVRIRVKMKEKLIY